MSGAKGRVAAFGSVAAVAQLLLGAVPARGEPSRRCETRRLLREVKSRSAAERAGAVRSLGLLASQLIRAVQAAEADSDAGVRRAAAKASARIRRRFEAATAEPTAKVAHQRRMRVLPDWAAKEIRRIGPTRYVVGRRLWRAVVANPVRWLERAGRVVVITDTHTGRWRCLAVYGIRTTSIYYHLGLRNGDRIDAIDGQPIVDFATLAERLSSSKTIRIAFRRRGRPMTLRYDQR